MAHGRQLRLVLTGAVLAAGAAIPVVIVPSASAVSRLSVVTARSSDTGSQSFKWAEARCPAGTHVLGGGAVINGTGAARRVHLSSILPIDASSGSSDSFYATAMEDPRGYSGSWSVTVSAICAAGLSGWEIVQNSVAAAPGARTTVVSADCPAGKKVIGVGGASTGGRPFILDAAMPGLGLDNAWADVTRDESPDAGQAWGAQAYAVCVNPVPNQTLVIADSALSTGSKRLRVSCPAGTRVHGVGGDLRTADGQAHITRLVPRSDTTADIDAHPDLTGTNATWSAHVFAICAS